MDLLTIIAVALGLSFDTFAVSLSFGVVQNRILFFQALKVAFIMAFFQAGFLVAGYFAGSFISEFIKAADHWVALILLSFLGIRMIAEGQKGNENNKLADCTKPLILISAAVGTSIDAFAVGISFALLELKIWISGIILGIVTFLASMTAIRIGKSAARRLDRKVMFVGGLILISIGIKIFLEHILA